MHTSRCPTYVFCMVPADFRLCLAAVAIYYSHATYTKYFSSKHDHQTNSTQAKLLDFY